MGVGVGLDDVDLFDAVGKVARYAADGFADIRSRSVEIDPGIEFGTDPAVVLLARRIDLPHPGNARNRIFEDARHFAVHGFGRSPRERGGDRDDRAIDIRQFANFDAGKRRKTGDHDQEVEHPDQQRPLDRKHRQIGLIRHRCRRRLRRSLAIRHRPWAQRPDVPAGSPVRRGFSARLRRSPGRPLSAPRRPMPGHHDAK